MTHPRPDIPGPWLGAGFHASAQRHPERVALEVAGEKLTYGELAARASFIAEALGPAPSDPPLTGIFAAGSVATYAGILGTLLKGHGYVPLNPKFPDDRLAYMLTHSGCRSIVVDAQQEARLPDLLTNVPPGLTVILADRAEVEGVDLPGHTVVAGKGASPLPPAPDVAGDDIAYILYTSGSTGTPKGVMVSHANVHHFLSVMQSRYGLRETDRFSQMFDLSFDLSVFDLFMSWLAGGTLVIPLQEDQLLAAEYIGRERITVWFSVPSVAVLLNRMRQLEPGRYPDLRYALFCGEALPADATGAFAAAAPNAILENLYGPTEVTLACTLYRWHAGAVEECENGNVPIGTAYDGMIARVVDEHLGDVAEGETGELMMVGPQVAPGYWKDPEKTAAVFVVDPATGAPAYRTGDLVRRPKGDEPIIYLGRIDHQIKLHGHRIELGEIEEALKDISGAPRTVVIGFPIKNGVPQGLVAFLEGDSFDRDAILEAAKARLPAYMIPNRLVPVPDFPANANGKIDRKALAAGLTKGK